RREHARVRGPDARRGRRSRARPGGAAEPSPHPRLQPMKLGFFLREALRSLGRNAMPSFAALATVLVTMLVLGVFIPIVQATTGAANEVRGRLLLDVYLKADATPADAQRVRGQIAGTPRVKRVGYVSKQAAYRQERKRNPEAYQLLGSNPLPDTFRVTPTK